MQKIKTLVNIESKVPQDPLSDHPKKKGVQVEHLGTSTRTVAGFFKKKLKKTKGKNMAEKKPNQKSIRISDETLAFVDRQPGEGFNQKFENAVIKFSKEEKELDQRLKVKKAEYAQLSKKVIELQEMVWELQSVDRAKKQFEERISEAIK